MTFWIFYRYNGRKIRHTIGTAPAFDLDKARTDAQEALRDAPDDSTAGLKQTVSAGRALLILLPLPAVGGFLAWLSLARSTGDSSSDSASRLQKSALESLDRAGHDLEAATSVGVSATQFSPLVTRYVSELQVLKAQGSRDPC